MNPNQQQVLRSIFLLQDECFVLAEELKTCLDEERSALIGLKTELIVHTNARKDNLGRQLKYKKKQIWNLVNSQYGLENTEGLEAHIAEPYRSEWLIKKANWLKIWKATSQTCETNQIFLGHSLRNLGLLVDNLKRLFGEQPLYTAKGAKAEAGSSGKVVEARF